MLEWEKFFMEEWIVLGGAAGVCAVFGFSEAGLVGGGI